MLNTCGLESRAAFGLGPRVEIWKVGEGMPLLVKGRGGEMDQALSEGSQAGSDHLFIVFIV